MVQLRDNADAREGRGVIVPPALYLPIVPGSDNHQVAVVRTLVDGRRGLLAYTALDRLADKCGNEQPWMLVIPNLPKSYQSLAAPSKLCRLLLTSRRAVP
ncbi:SAV_915 family protein [uncultured Microbacterium sp.]|uniref:SAV_915 family protein n=1 Tax=uncultured Microbacterium sp. TaxID=191216 RepID=UPI00345BBD5E